MERLCVVNLLWRNDRASPIAEFDRRLDSGCIEVLLRAKGESSDELDKALIRASSVRSVRPLLKAIVFVELSVCKRRVCQQESSAGIQGPAQ